MLLNTIFSEIISGMFVLTARFSLATNGLRINLDGPRLFLFQKQ